MIIADTYKWYRHYSRPAVYYAFFFSDRHDSTNAFIYRFEHNRWEYEGAASMNQAASIWTPAGGDEIPSAMLRLTFKQIFEEPRYIR